jgi:MFS family permease
VSDETRAANRPATFRDVFASREYRFLFGATVLSWLGDYMAKAAVTALVFQHTKSVALSALAFAISYLPWIAGGPVLAAIAERKPFRTVMVTCDVARAALMLLVALPKMPVAAMIALLFAASLANPPSEAARSALYPQLLTGDRFVVALALRTSSGQGAQLIGYMVGAAIAPFHPRLAIGINAITFAVSALLIRFGVGDRRAVGDPGPRQHLARETAAGFRMVFGTKVLRVIAVVVFSSTLFAIVPEGLAAAWAAKLSVDESQRGWIQGMIMVASPAGFILGGLLVGRLVRPERRVRLIPVFMVAAPLALVPAFAHPPPAAIAAMALVCGFAIAGLLAPANGLFVQSLPAGYRGVQVTQGVAVVATGALAIQFDISTVVGAWSLAGVAVLLLVAIRWPSPDAFELAAARARAANGEAHPQIPAPGRHRAGPVQAPV